MQYEKRVLLALEAQSIISFQCKKTNQTSLLPVQKGGIQVSVPVLEVRSQCFRVHRNAQGIATGTYFHTAKVNENRIIYFPRFCFNRFASKTNYSPLHDSTDLTDSVGK